MINAPVLVLNQNYEPLNVCDIRRAFRLLGAEKAELLERNHQVIHTPTLAIRGAIGHSPAVPRQAPAPAREAEPARGLRRDRHTCQYCGAVEPRPDHRPRRAQAPRRPPRVGEPRRRVPRLQPPQGRARRWPRRGCTLLPRAARPARRRALPVRHLPRRRAQRRLAQLPLPGRPSDARPRRQLAAASRTDARRRAPCGSTCPPAVAGRARHAAPTRATRRPWSAARARPAPRRRAASRLGRRHRRAARDGRRALSRRRRWENRFGTVTVATRAGRASRSPPTARGGLPRPAPPGRGALRRLAGRGPGAARLHDQRHGLAAARPRSRPRPLVDPFGGHARPRGAACSARSAIRGTASREDALRWSAAARFADPPGPAIDPPTEAAIRAHAPTLAALSGERVRDELLRMLGGSPPAAPPSRAAR